MTDIVRSSSPASVARAVQTLRSGGIVVFPTETSYGIACDPLNDDTVRALYRLKGRGRKALPFIAASTQQMRHIAVLSRRAEGFASPHWPGPLALSLPVKKSYHSRALSGRATIAIRVTGHPWARRLATRFGMPLVATSANRSGQRPAYSLAACRRALGRTARVPILWVDGGTLPKRRASTIAAICKKSITILRQGDVVLDSR